MNFVHVYDVQSQAREKLFDWIRPLSQEQYVQSFPFGLHTLQTTMVELAGTELWLAMRIRGDRFPEPFDWDEWPIREATCPTFADVEGAWRKQMPQTRAALEVHHRAQAMAMLRQFGIAAQDVDFIDFVQEIRREDREPGT